jgi:diguanylate cyclase (GGDEF)-like protein/PAS domain S-box-containing protein
MHPPTLHPLTLPEGTAQHGPPEGLIDALALPIARWDRHCRLVYCSAPYLAWARQPRDALIGRTLAQIYGESAWAAARNAFAGAFAGRPMRYERRLTHQGAGARWARIQLFPEHAVDGTVAAVVSIAFDVHDDVLARETLDAARKRIDRFTDQIPYPLTYTDRNYVLRFVNQAYIDATGQSITQLLGRPIGSVRGARRWAEHKPWFDRALAGESVEYTRLVHRADRGERWTRTGYVPDFDDDGRVVGVYTVTIDVHDLTVARDHPGPAAGIDETTRVFSRDTLLHRLDAALKAAGAPPVALFCVHLDGVEPGDRLPRSPAADRLMLLVAQALQHAVRAGDVVGRWGAGGFGVLAPMHDAAGGHVLAQHLLQAVRDGGELPGAPAGVTASIGYALAPGDSREPAELWQLAEAAAGRARHAGRNRALHSGPESI